MTIVGIDDTDSRTRGMCTTYVAARVGERLSESGATVDRTLLVRLNPAVEYKTRGNAALAIHTGADPDTAFEAARETIEELAETDDANTNPGLVVLDGPDAPTDLASFARDAVRDHHTVGDALALAHAHATRHRGWGNDRGVIGALAAVGSRAAFDDWTYEHVAYREPERWGARREVDADSAFGAADAAYPAAWDTVDRGTGDVVCVPRTPCPILYGIRGDDPDAVRRVAAGINAEPVARTALFLTNQGTDAHLRDVPLDAVEDGRAYRTTGTVATEPETKRGGHVFFELRDGDAAVRCTAFEPTKRFRERVRALRPGDRITTCGEVSDGTLKLEKFAVRDLDAIVYETPDCPGCGRSMESAGRDQGYRCRDCGTSADGKVPVEVERDLEHGWYEVPPSARRHVAKPLVRGGFDAPVHPER